jgi:geranylgeranyl pyrophosphate synthase
MERLVLEVRKSSGVKRSLDEAQEYIQKALETLAGMPESAERQALEDLARYTVTRKI